MASFGRVGLLVLVLGFLGCQRDAVAPDSAAPGAGPSFAKPGPPPPPADPAIAFKVTGTVDKLYVMNADGSNQAMIVEGEKFSAFLARPSWSRNGGSVVFTGKPKGQPDGMWIVDVVPVSGTPTGQNLRRILSYGAHPAWSPAADSIVFVDCAGACSLALIAATGGVPGVLYTPAGGRNVGEPDWSPDGSRLVFTESDQFAPPALLMLDRGSSQVTTILRAGDFALLRFTAWSRAGDRIAFSGSHQDTDPEALFLVDATPLATPTQLVGGGAPTWSPNDGKLAFTGPTGGGLFTYELANGRVTKIAKSGWMADWRRF
jgi:Tol biopolymer transport system component